MPDEEVKNKTQLPPHVDMPTQISTSSSGVLLAIDDDFSDEDDERVDDDATELLGQIKVRCDSAKIRYEASSDPDNPFMRVYIPAGRETRSIFIANAAIARQLLASQFENISYVGDYEAICNYQEGSIDATLNSLGQGLSGMRLRELFGLKSYRELNDGRRHDIEIPAPADHPNVQITLSLQGSNSSPFASRFNGLPRTTLLISGLEITTNDRAVDLLERIANSLLFEIDLRFNIPLTPMRHRRQTGLPVGRIDSGRKLSELPLQFPLFAYDKTALSLYWYGRSASGLPLLKFLAFYQSLEFYFPTYSQNEAIQKAKRMLKDPRFSIHDDGHLAKLVGSIQTSRAGAFGDERAQFKTVLNACVSADVLRSFLERESLRVFYTDTKQVWKQISKVKIPLGDSDADLRGSIAERLYDIRCRIVHAKGAAEQAKDEALLPFSREADQLVPDTQVIQFVATQTLIASSTRLVL